MVALVWAMMVRTAEVPVAQESHAFSADYGLVTVRQPPAYGTNLWWTDQDAELWTERWAELMSSLVRVHVSHASVEPVNDNDDPNMIDWNGFALDAPIAVPGITRTTTYRAWFEAVYDQPNLHLLLFFPYLAPWLSDNDPHFGAPEVSAPHPANDLAEYREFVEAVLRYLVETIGFPPQRILVEATNEPDLGCDVDPVTPCFWDNWTMSDVADVVRVTHEAIHAVDEDIRLVGLAECCGTALVRDLLDHYAEGDYLEGVSYHYYSPSGYDLTEALNRAAALSPYSLPIYLDEYGSLQYLSEGSGGALWHSWALPTLWEQSIGPLQYPISEWPLLGEPYNSMGLFEDWRGDWQRKPSYWVQANFFQFAGGGEVVSSTLPSQVYGLATRQLVEGEVRTTFWTVHRGSTGLDDQTFAVYNFPYEAATLRVYDNLVGPTAVLTEAISGSPLVFTATLPASSSYAFVLSTAADRVYMPLIVRRDTQP